MKVLAKWEAVGTGVFFWGGAANNPPDANTHSPPSGQSGCGVPPLPGALPARWGKPPPHDPSVVKALHLSQLAASLRAVGGCFLDSPASPPSSSWQPIHSDVFSANRVTVLKTQLLIGWEENQYDNSEYSFAIVTQLGGLRAQPLALITCFKKEKKTRIRIYASGAMHVDQGVGRKNRGDRACAPPMDGLPLGRVNNSRCFFHDKFQPVESCTESRPANHNHCAVLLNRRQLLYK